MRAVSGLASKAHVRTGLGRGSGSLGKASLLPAASISPKGPVSQLHSQSRWQQQKANQLSGWALGAAVQRHHRFVGTGLASLPDYW
eukprot:SAG31_NODE_30521_length_380_cov_0.576512_1_plen_85_part_10